MSSSSARALRPDRVERLSALRESVHKALHGKAEPVELAIISLLARGHVLVEDVPGVGKTTLARALAKALGSKMNRVQFTSDLLPSDLLGVSVFDQKKGDFTLRRGPVFTNVLLADEINRASPRTQSALLEAMNDGQVSIDGQTLPLPSPFLVLATQNPQEFAGTFPLPESQLDRFMVRLSLGYPSSEVETRLILDGSRDRVADVEEVFTPESFLELQGDVDDIRLDGALATYLQAVIAATRSSSNISLGASTRAAINLAQAARARALLRGRDYCIADDIHDLATPMLSHRVRLSAITEGYSPSRDEAESTVRDIITRVPVPI